VTVAKRSIPAAGRWPGAALALVLALGGTAGAFAQEAPPPAGRTLQIEARPRAGDSIRLELRKEQERQAPNQPAQRSANLLHVTVEVLESGPQGMVVRWSHARPAGTEGQGASAAPDDADVIWELVQEIRYELEFDGRGEFVQLRNYDEVRPLVDRMLAQIGAILARRGDATAAERATAIVRRMFAERANLEAVLLREPRMFFFPLGKSFTVEAPREYEALLPNPLGGAGLPARGVQRVDWVDNNRGLASVTVEQTLPPESARIVIESLIARLPPERRPAEAELSQVNIEMRDVARYTVNLNDGLPERMDFARTTQVPGNARRDAVSMRRLE